MDFLERFGLLPTDDEVDQNRELSERYDPDSLEALDPDLLVPENIRSLTADDINPWIAQEAHELVLYYEVGGQRGYQRRFRRPIWPKYQSGVTIGIGYDLGYNTREEVTAAWGARLSADALEKLLTTVGVKGRPAEALLGQVRDVEVDWQAALEVYKLTTVVKFGKLTLSAFPGANQLHPKCFGSLFSLVYNRGSSMRGNRRREMRNIRRAISAGRLDDIPTEIRNMKRLWAGRGLRGLLKRRDAEARLFEDGLLDARNRDQIELPPPPVFSAMSPSQSNALAAGTISSTGSGDANGGGDGADTIAIPQRHVGHSQYRRVSSLEKVYPDAVSDEGDGDGEHWDGEETEPASAMGDEERMALERRSDWSKVHWTNNDTLSSEYQHLVEEDRTGLAGKIFSFSAGDLDLLVRANRFEPEMSHNGKIVFGLRGVTLEAENGTKEDSNQQVELPSLRLREVKPNHKTFRCVIGVYDVERQLLSGFRASTVPNRFAVAYYASTQKSGNMLPAGCYRYVVGRHRTHQGCLREHERFAVHRNTNNLVYEVDDKIVPGTPFDNIHPSFRDRHRSAEFSSFGCQVIRGTIRSGNRHAGEWRNFRDALGLRQAGDGDHGHVFYYVLLTGLEAAIAADMRVTGRDGDINEVTKRLSRLRQGSRGPAVETLQVAINVDADGRFGPKTKEAFWQFQTEKGLVADGVYSPALDDRLELNILTPSPIAVASNSPTTVASVIGLESRTLQYGLTPLENLYLELGRRARAADSDPGWLASEKLERLENLNRENVEGLIAYGKAAFSRVERSIYELICGDSDTDARDRGAIVDALTQAATQKVTGQASLLAFLETFLLAKCFLIPPINKIVARILVEEIIEPTINDMHDFAAPFAKLACQRWSKQIMTRDIGTTSLSASGPVQSATEVSSSS